MNEQDKKGIHIVSIICIGVLTMTLFTGVILLSGYAVIRLRCTEKVDAVVTELIEDTSTDDNGYTKNYYRPVFSYVYDGHEYKVKSNTASNPPRYEVNEKLELHIDPDSPEFIYEGRAVILLFIGIWYIVIGGVGAALFFVILVIIKHNKVKLSKESYQ